jgi:pyruvate kinase
MLSGETSIGKFPVEAVRFMDDIVAAAEQSPCKDDRQDRLRQREKEKERNREARERERERETETETER